MLTTFIYRQKKQRQVSTQIHFSKRTKHFLSPSLNRCTYPRMHENNLLHSRPYPSHRSSKVDKVTPTVMQPLYIMPSCIKPLNVLSFSDGLPEEERKLPLATHSPAAESRPQPSFIASLHAAAHKSAHCSAVSIFHELHHRWDYCA